MKIIFSYFNVLVLEGNQEECFLNYSYPAIIVFSGIVNSVNYGPIGHRGSKGVLGVKNNFL